MNYERWCHGPWTSLQWKETWCTIVPAESNGKQALSEDSCSAVFKDCLFTLMWYLRAILTRRQPWNEAHVPHQLRSSFLLCFWDFYFVLCLVLVFKGSVILSNWGPKDTSMCYAICHGHTIHSHLGQPHLFSHAPAISRVSTISLAYVSSFCLSLLFPYANHMALCISDPGYHVSQPRIPSSSLGLSTTAAH
jgi:hypothetical protein